MAKQVKRAALYVRVSTDHQTLENQIHELTQIAERRGWEVFEIYKDHGISGAKGRDKRPGLDLMLTDASRRKFDVVMSWAIDRLGARLLYAGESARKGSGGAVKWEAEAAVGGLRRVLTPLLGSFSSLQTDSSPGPV